MNVSFHPYSTELLSHCDEIVIQYTLIMHYSHIDRIIQAFVSSNFSIVIFSELHENFQIPFVNRIDEATLW